MNKFLQTNKTCPPFGNRTVCCRLQMSVVSWKGQFLTMERWQRTPKNACRYIHKCNGRRFRSMAPVRLEELVLTAIHLFFLYCIGMLHWIHWFHHQWSIRPLSSRKEKNHQRWGYSLGYAIVRVRPVHWATQTVLASVSRGIVYTSTSEIFVFDVIKVSIDEQVLFFATNATLFSPIYIQSVKGERTGMEGEEHLTQGLMDPQMAYQMQQYQLMNSYPQ